jgi:hypothetical protein
MAQATQTKLNKLTIIQLYEHYGALERTLPLLTPESQELAKAELEACVALRSEKIDRIYYAMASHEDAIERIKKEKVLILTAQKHHESQLKSLKGLLNYLRRLLPLDSNKITGRDYQFTLSRKKELTVEVNSDPQFWSSEERQQFCIEEEITTTKKIVVRSMTGEILSERIEPTDKTTVLPNLDAIRDAHQAGKPLPFGVKVYQEYSIRSKRIYGKPSMDIEASEYPGNLLPED